jgi:1-deoxy-D-xylulose-5-phosphate reductoisomerase
MAVTLPRANNAVRTVTVLGSTGSVGCNTLNLISRNPDEYSLVALTANTNVALLAEQARQFRPTVTVIADHSKYSSLKKELSGTGLQVEAGREALIEAAQRPAEWVMAAIVGAAGLEPTLAAAHRGAIVALANKECLVCAGPLLMEEVRSSGATLLPVDSEHNAIFQVFDYERRDAIDRVILTASGGPFRTLDMEVMAHVTPAQAVAHPTWNMGAKISVDSATMMNKGLELIEAHQIFQMPEESIDILIHPQSVVHSLVAYIDGSVLAQLGVPDMRTPIAYTLGWPDRMATPAARLDLAELGQLTFERPDPHRFPALRLAREALKQGGAAPNVLNAANEVAVDGFLRGSIGFLEIAQVVEEVLAVEVGIDPQSLEDVLDIDGEARRIAREKIRSKYSSSDHDADGEFVGQKAE